MDEDVNVVDDFEPQTPIPNGINSRPGPSTSTTTSSRPIRAAAERANLRRRSSPSAYDPDFVSSERTTRSHGKGRFAPKLKLKLSEKAAAYTPGVSFLGPYDRELDSDDEELSFEEQFILRMPEGDDCERLKKMVASREISPDVWFKFKDSRRAIFHIGNNTYSSKLVDLPCIIESQKTLDNKQMFKVADICQMLLVDEKIPNEEALSNSKAFNIDDFIWPHGISPPLHNVRKRRFRKRINKRTIESVEQEVERLLQDDAEADDVKYDVLDNVNPDLSDSEYLEREDEHLDPQTPGGLASEMGDAPTPAAGALEKHSDEEGDEDDEGDGEIDEELAAELDLALNDEQQDEDEEDEEDESEEDDEDDEDEDEDDEVTQARQLLNEEIGDLEKAVQKKEMEVASAGNPLIRRRFEDMLKKLSADLEMKRGQRDEMREQARRKKLGFQDEDGGGEESGADGAGEGEDGADNGMDGEMDIGMQLAMAMGAPPQGPPMNDEDMDLFGGDGEEDGMDMAPG